MDEIIRRYKRDLAVRGYSERTRIAISNYRIIGVEDGEVLFSYKDYSQSNQKKVLRLDVNEFIRRFMLIIKGFDHAAIDKLMTDKHSV